MINRTPEWPRTKDSQLNRFSKALLKWTVVPGSFALGADIAASTAVHKLFPQIAGSLEIPNSQGFPIDLPGVIAGFIGFGLGLYVVDRYSRINTPKWPSQPGSRR